MISEKKETDSCASSSLSFKLQNCKIGDRISCLDDFGTVKYIGNVEGYQGTWLGIEWDNINRGKHDGTVNGKEYFKGRHPKSSSFVRPEKVEFGKTAVESIVERYGCKKDIATSTMEQQALLSFQQTINAPFLEMVGFDKITNVQSHFESLKVVALRKQNINSPGLPGELRNLCPNLQELDISKNLLTSWTQIFDICSQLDQLHWLVVSENALSFPKDVSKYCFKNLKTLVCTSMNLTWSEVVKLARVFPNLIEFRAPSNNIKDLTTPDDVFKNLSTLDLEDNPIELWSEVCKLAVLENLEDLMIGRIGLKAILFEGNKGKVSIFRNLKKLWMIENLIDNWESIGELNRLENLEDLRFVRNPILETLNEAMRYQIVVAKIANLKILNGTMIKPDDRRGAEYDYLKLYGLEWLKVKGTPDEEGFLKSHNRYLELIQKYGELEESELKIEVKSIKNTLVTLVLKCGNKSISKKLPETISVQKLVMLMQKLFNLDDRPSLVYVSSLKPDIRIPLDDHQREIGFYSIQEGDEIIATVE